MHIYFHFTNEYGRREWVPHSKDTSGEVSSFLSTFKESEYKEGFMWSYVGDSRTLDVQFIKMLLHVKISSNKNRLFFSLFLSISLAVLKYFIGRKGFIIIGIGYYWRFASLRMPKIDIPTPENRPLSERIPRIHRKT